MCSRHVAIQPTLSGQNVTSQLHITLSFDSNPIGDRQRKLG